MILTGRRVTGPEAYFIGLCDRLVEAQGMGTNSLHRHLDSDRPTFTDIQGELDALPENTLARNAILCLLLSPETRLAIIPGAGGTYRLPSVIGVNRARDMILTGHLHRYPGRA
jgi:enoyl-CoA hydratase/carnithine racemase